MRSCLIVEGLTVHDAVIACWNAKYAYNLQPRSTTITVSLVGNASARRFKKE
jgi:hypothetical protein